MSALLLLVAVLLGAVGARLHRLTGRLLEEATRLAGPPVDPETGMLREDALEVIVGGDVSMIHAEGRSMSVVVCAVHSRTPETTMRAVERVRRAHEPCIRLGSNRFAIIWHDDSGPDYLDGALPRLGRTILEHCQVADIGVAVVHDDDVPPRGLVDRARAAARPVQDFVPDVTS